MDGSWNLANLGTNQTKKWANGHNYKMVVQFKSV